MLEVSEGPREWKASLPGDAVWVLEAEPFHSVCVRFVGGLLGPLVGDFVALNALVARAPPNLDADTRFLGAEGGSVRWL